jgi:hypothetical protein
VEVVVGVAPPTVAGFAGVGVFMGRGCDMGVS